MELRSRAMMGANALLYFGPLLAGLGGAGWSLIPVFVAIFVLWTVVVQIGNAGGEGKLVGGALTQVLTQTLIIAICFGIGRGIGGVLNSMPSIPVYLPVALSLLSLPLARIRQEAAPLPQAKAAPMADKTSSDIALAHQLLDALDQQSLSANGEDLPRHVDVIASQVSRSAILGALNARGPLSPVLERTRSLLQTQSSQF